MSDITEQLEGLRRRMEARHIETLAKLEAQRLEGKADLKAFREELILTIERQ